jgi:uncharacterized protein (TIGR03435 family)
MTRKFAVAIPIAIAAWTVTGQTGMAPSGFEVASIKPSDPAAGGTQIGVSPGGVFTAKNVTLKVLMQQAYDVRDFQVAGGPGWLDTDRYDIVAKGDGTGPSEDELRTMTDRQRNLFKEQLITKLRTLLSDRFQLKVHPETRELPVYALVVAKNGARIQATADDDVTHSSLRVSRGDGGKSEMTGNRIPLASLAKSLSDHVGRTVLDQTGLQGNYDFKLTFAPDMAPESADGPSIFTALQEQLGLRLDAQKGPVQVVVIDSVQKASEN